MNTYEFTVTSSMTDSTGMASLRSICKCITKAVKDDIIRKKQPLILLRTRFEIDERPKRDEIFNVVVISECNINSTCQNRIVKLTDTEGEEIGNGVVELESVETPVKDAAIAAQGRSMTRLLGNFFNLVPRDFSSSGLQALINIRFNRLVRQDDDLSFGLRKARDDRYVFLARSGDETLCRAMLQNA